ncbi:TonB-dependent receptor [Nguyenibacter vanlangensis]|uniref:TonB-dependent receptor n=1 Tax=Nguyenibacter vanlangensis TaxID=1216886 RepID=A0A7Y7IT91_9PROT|nr:TonB-dependent receptor [Nguyenibacter vanlangensis]NVN09890.1 TonB-dependent receptor [Nguyenibacter vanlangensis]
MRFRGFRTVLFASVALVPCAAIAAMQPVAPQSARKADTRKGAVKPSASMPKRAAAITTEDIQVFGGGSTRQMATISSSELRRSVPGTSAMKVLARLPSVNFMSADPFGAYEWSTRITVRGFAQDQLGFTLDDIPLGPMEYDTERGINVNRTVLSENIRSTTVSQGAGSVEVPSLSNLGGTMQFYTADPSLKPGGTVQQTFGSNDTFRTFARVDSGALNGSGTRFFLSYAHSTLDKWKGAGSNLYDQINAKLVQPFGDHTTWTTYFDWSDRKEIDYQDLSMNYIHILGPNWDNYYPDYAAAYNAALGTYTRGENKTNDALDAAYYAGSGLRQDFVGSTTLDTALGHGMTWRTTAYAIADAGFSTWVTPYTPSPNGAPLSMQGRDEGGQRYGLVSNFAWRYMRNDFHTGIWFENNNYIQNRRLYQEPLLGQGQPLSPYVWQNTQNAFLDEWGYVFNTNTFQFHLYDTYRVLPNLQVNAGFKSLVSTTRSGILFNNPAFTGQDTLPSGGLTAAAAFLPQVSASWKVTSHDELFFDVSKNMSTFSFSGWNQGSPFGITDANAFRQEQKSLKPQTAWVYEAGYRIHRRWFDGLLTGYRANFSNRLLTIAQGSIINSYATVQNVGGVTMNGLEVSGTIHFPRHISWYNSFSWNRATYDNNYTTSSGVAQVRGKQAPNMPILMWKSQISYRYKGFSTDIDENYEGHRYVDYMNTVAAPHYFITNFGASYDFGQLGALRNLSLQLNIYNLLGQKWIAVVGEEGNPLQGDYQSFMPGAPRQFFGTISAHF